MKRILTFLYFNNSSTLTNLLVYNFKVNLMKVLTLFLILINSYLLDKLTYNQLQSQLTRSADCEPNVLQLRNQVTQKDSTISQLQQQISELSNRIILLTSSDNDKDRTISQYESQTSQLQQQVSEKNSTISQLQARLSGCVTVDVDLHLQEMSQALANEMQRQQLCLQTINQLNSESSSLKFYYNLVLDLANRYPRLLPSFVYDSQQPGSQSPLPDVNNWTREQLSTISPQSVVSLVPFKSMVQTPSLDSSTITPNVNIISNDPTGRSITTDPDFIRYSSLKQSLGLRTKTKANPVNESQKEYNKLYHKLYSKYGYVPDV